jgi:hypothetical protein
MAEFFKGTVLASPIVNSSSGDTYGTHHSVLGVGGYMEVKTTNERDSIPMDSIFPTIYFDGISSGRRRLGMLVHVLEDDIIYQLHPKVGGNYVTYSTWTGYTDTQKYTALSGNSGWYPLFITGTGSTNNVEQISKGYTQTTHGFVKGDVVGYDGSDLLKVSSLSAATIEPIGLVSVSDYNGTGGTNTNITITYAGNINTSGILDYSGGTLVNGSLYYLASSGYTGKLTTLVPTTLNEISKPILLKLSGNTGIVLQYRGTSKADQGLTIGEFNQYTGNTQLFLDKTVTGATNIGYFSGQTGLQTITILTSNTLYNGDYNSLYNYYYRDSGGIIRIGSPDYHGILRRGYLSTFTPRRSWLYNTYTGSSNQIGWILVDGDISQNVGNFLTANNIAANAGTPVFSETEWWYTGGTMNDGYYSNSAVSLDVNGNTYTGTTYDIGGPVYRDKVFKELRFRTIVSNSPSTIKVTYNDDFIFISGSTSGSTVSGGTITGVTGITNLGTGFGIYETISDNTVQLNSIIGSGQTTIQKVNNTLIVYSSGATDTVTGVTNVGNGYGIFTGITSNNLQLKTINVSGSSLSIVDTPNSIIISGLTVNSIQTANNGLTKVGTNVVLGGVLTGNTTLSGNYTLNISGNAKINTTSGYQISGTTILKTTSSDINSIYIGNGGGIFSGNTGFFNVGIGYQSLYSNGIGEINSGIGYRSLYSNVSGCRNIGIGFISLCNNTIGSCNIAIGEGAGGDNITGSSNIFIGGCAGVGVGQTGSNQLYIGNSTGSTLIYGNMSTNEVTLPTLKICNTLPNGTCSDSIMVWNSTDKYVRKVPYSSGGTTGDINNCYSNTLITGNTTLTTGSSYVILFSGNTNILANLPLSPFNGEAFKFKDVSGNAAINNITISGSTNNIDGSPFALINTNYGSMNVMYTCNSPVGWYVLGSV